MKVWAVRLWAESTFLPENQRQSKLLGRFEVDQPAGVPIARILRQGAVAADPNLFPPLYDAQLVKVSGTCVRLRGFEKPSPRRRLFQEWILDYHPDGRGQFDMTLDEATKVTPSRRDLKQPVPTR